MSVVQFHVKRATSFLEQTNYSGSSVTLKGAIKQINSTEAAYLATTSHIDLSPENIQKLDVLLKHGDLLLLVCNHLPIVLMISL